MASHPPIEERIARLKEVGAIEASSSSASADGEPLLRSSQEMPGAVLAEKSGLSLAQILLFLFVFLPVFGLSFWWLSHTSK